MANDGVRGHPALWIIFSQAGLFAMIASGRCRLTSHFTVGLRAKGKADRVVVDAEDALIAALKVKAEHPDATIMYVRRMNRRGDTRHPAHSLANRR